MSVNLKTKLEAYLKNNESSLPVTLNTLAKALNVSKQTLYNNKKLLTENGINITHASSRVAKEEEIPFLTNNNVSTAPLTNILYLTVHSFVSEYLVIPCKYAYTDELRDKWLDKKLTLSSAEVYLQRCFDSAGFLEQDEKWELTFLLEDLRHYKNLRFSKREKDDASTYFFNLTGHQASEEQVKTLSSLIRFVKTGDNFRFGHIQALAGASKTTIFNVLIKYLGDNTDLVVHSVAPTRLAATCLENGVTLHSLVDKLLGIKSAEISEERLLRLVEGSILSGSVKQVDLLLVDEYTMFSSELIKVIKCLAKCIIFSGDIGQNTRNCCYSGPLLGTLTYQYRFKGLSADLQKQLTKLRFRNDLEGIKNLIESLSLGTFKGSLVVSKEGTTLQKRTDYTGSFNHLKSILEEYKNSDSVVVAYSKAAVTEINELLNEGFELKQGSKVSLSKTLYNPTVIPSGTQGRVMSVYKDKDVVRYKVLFDNTLVEVNRDCLALAYAVTCISSQGSAWKKVLVVTGTSNQDNYVTDVYVGTSRAEVDLKTISRSGVEDSINHICDALFMEEGNRNNNVYRSINAVMSLAESKGLPREESLNVLSKITGCVKPVKNYTSISETIESSLSRTPQTLKNNYGFVLITGYNEKGDELKWYPNGEDQRNKTKEEAQYLLDQCLKTGKYVTGYLTEELCGGNRIVIDCDNEKTVNLFLKYKDITESYYSKDSMHLVFTVDKFFKRSSFNQEDGFKGDLLGNATYSLRNVKDNKTPNYKEAVPLPVEVEQLLSQLTK